MTRGTAVLIEVTFNLQSAFGSLQLVDPSNPTITVTAPDNSVKVTDAVLTRHSLGQYYYTLQTSSSWVKGWYTSTVQGTYSTMNIKLNQIKSFILE